MDFRAKGSRCRLESSRFPGSILPSPNRIFTSDAMGASHKGTLLGTPNREPQEYSRNIMEYKDPGWYIPIIYLLYSWGSRFGVPSRVPLSQASQQELLNAFAIPLCSLGPLF